MICCRNPVWLKTAFTVLVQEGGVLVHGWCAEKENRGKGGSGKGKIGAGVGSCHLWIQSGSRRDPVGHQFLHFWAPLLASRDPVGHQCREAAKFIKNSIFAVFLHVFRWFWLLPDRSKRGAKNLKIGARLDPDWPKAVPKNAKIGSRLGPDPVSSKKHLFP